MIERAVNRVVSHLLEPYKLLIAALILFLAGIITAFFTTFSVFANSLMQKTMFLIPIFIALGLLLSLGSFLCTLYFEELRQQKANILPTFKNVWMKLLGASYFSIPFLAAFAVLWVSIGLFEVLSLIPYVGPLFKTLFAFIPFVINLALYLLVLVGLLALFLLSPVLALGEINKEALKKTAAHFLKNPFKNIQNFFIALVPGLILGSIGYLALTLCSFCHQETHPLLILLQNISLAIPFTILLILPTVFFFQYALESYFMIEQEK